MLYGFLLAFSFGVMPFVYFYFEEENEDNDKRAQAMGALKYTVAFIVVFGVLIALGVVLKSGKFQSDGTQKDQWVDNLKGSFAGATPLFSSPPLALPLVCLTMTSRRCPDERNDSDDVACRMRVCTW